MIIEFAKDFDKSVKRIKDKLAIKRLIAVIEKLKKAKSLNEVSNVMALSNYPLHYRIRIGDYRLFVEAKDVDLIEILLIEYLKRNEKTYQKYN
jgi:mRNA interferase RelE/StbE